MDFSQALNKLVERGFSPRPPIPHIQVPNAKEALMQGLRHYVGEDAKWLPAYDKIAEWLTDNQRRGLLCTGPCSVGKTLICYYILPVILHYYCGKLVSVYDAKKINNNPDAVINDPILVIDDIGVEGELNDYGNHRVIFNEVVDECERKGHLLIVTTNLATVTPEGKGPDFPSIENIYGIRTIERLRAITKAVKFSGEGMRGKK